MGNYAYRGTGPRRAHCVRAAPLCRSFALAVSRQQVHTLARTAQSADSAQASARRLKITQSDRLCTLLPLVASMVAVKKDFLSKGKKAGGARAVALAQAGVGSQGSMDEDSRSYFGFLFPLGSDHWEVYCLICEYVKDFLEEFTLEVLGVTNADGHTASSIEGNRSVPSIR